MMSKAHVVIDDRKKPSITRGGKVYGVIELTDGRKGGEKEPNWAQKRVSARGSPGT